MLESTIAKFCLCLPAGVIIKAIVVTTCEFAMTIDTLKLFGWVLPFKDNFCDFYPLNNLSSDYSSCIVCVLPRTVF